ncbi:MAG TPA: ClpXP protease specificity-enhancing factor SspB [Acetobacteraceae bacterium]|jgi:hypothetical protein|nr:ClpXP protease specificity-enhancing factor SspB [Acetobacteraceae bacterium]
MEDDPQQQVESLLPYERWIAAALRHVVAQAIDHVSQHGLPGGHHFYISFRTTYPGVVIPPRLRAQYPEEMTIVLQHQFWDLKLDDEARTISVGLSFGGVPSTLVIPLDALISFADPQIRYALRFEPVEPEVKTTALAAVPRVPDSEPDAEAAPAPQVVSLDAFRRRPPPKS